MIKRILRRYALKRSTRFDIYRKAHDYYSKAIDGDRHAGGYCIVLFSFVNEALGFPDKTGCTLDYLPELNAYKPKINHLNGAYWYPTNHTGTVQRLLILLEILSNE